MTPSWHHSGFAFRPGSLGKTDLEFWKQLAKVEMEIGKRLGLPAHLVVSEWGKEVARGRMTLHHRLQTLAVKGKRCVLTDQEARCRRRRMCPHVLQCTMGGWRGGASGSS